MIGDAKTPGIVRGTAVSLLPPHLGPLVASRAREGRHATTDPLVRLGAATTLEALPPQERVRIGVHLLWDPVRAVRVEAVSAFADVPDAELETEARAAFDRSLDDFCLAQRSNAERPESHVNLGIVNVKRGRLDEARRNYDTALRLGPWFVPAYVNLADLLRQQGRDDEGEKVLREALRVDPQNAGVHHALGLLLVRAKRGERGPRRAEAGRRARARRPGLRLHLRDRPALGGTRRRGPGRAARRRRSAAPAREASWWRSSRSSASAGRCGRRGMGPEARGGGPRGPVGAGPRRFARASRPWRRARLAGGGRDGDRDGRVPGLGP